MKFLACVWHLRQTIADQALDQFQRSSAIINRSFFAVYRYKLYHDSQRLGTEALSF